MSRGGVHVSVRRVAPGTAVMRAARLLDMMYKPSEIAEELKIKKRAIYEVLIPLGLPHERDENGRIWLHGPTVRAWLETATRGPRYPLEDDEFFCLKCFAPRRVSPQSAPPIGVGGDIGASHLGGDTHLVREGKFVLARAKCPECGSLMFRGVGKRQARRMAAAGLIDESELSIFEEEA